MKGTGVLLLLVMAPALLGAQEHDIRDARLPRDVENRVLDAFDDPSTVRLAPPAHVPADSAIAGDVLVDGGALALDGRVGGDVIVLGGDLRFGPAASVGGDVIVVGGGVGNAQAASIGGTVLLFERSVAPQARRERERPPRDGRRHSERDPFDGRAGITVRVDNNYNRVEGLPIRFGPVLETRAPNRTRLEGVAVWRAEPSESLHDEIGYEVELSQQLARGRLRFGGGVSSLVRPIETNGLGSIEAGLSAVLFHSDPHDYYQRRGWSLFAEWSPVADRVLARLGFSDFDYDAVGISDPWTLFDGDDPWRPQPLAARGDASLLDLDVEWDGRDNREHPTAGWLLRVGGTHALDHELALPPLLADASAPPRFDDFTTARVDVRRYTPITRESTLNLRLFASGAVEETVLPTQFQHALGGLGTLPGYGTLSAACGSREPQGPWVVGYGCDRVLLGQLEYRGGFQLDFGDRDDERRDRDREEDGDRRRDGDRERDRERDRDPDEDRDRDWRDRQDRRDRDGRHRHDWHDIDVEADWVLFANAGRGWANGDLPLGPLGPPEMARRGDTDTLYDVGLGLLFGDAGIYAAVPLTGEGRSLRLFLRLDRRF